MLLFMLLILLLLIITYLLLVSIVLYIDTSTNQYFIKIKGLAKVSLETDEIEIFKVHLKVLFFNFFFYPLKKIKLERRNKVKGKTSKKKRFKSVPIKKILSVINSCKVRRFQLNVDTGDYILNSKLYPIFTFLNYKSGGFHINFQGKNQMVLLMHNRPFYIIKSFINN